jgi:hypothetical protein
MQATTRLFARCPIDVITTLPIRVIFRIALSFENERMMSYVLVLEEYSVVIFPEYMYNNRIKPDCVVRGVGRTKQNSTRIDMLGACWPRFSGLFSFGIGRLFVGSN